MRSRSTSGSTLAALALAVLALELPGASGGSYDHPTYPLVMVEIEVGGATINEDLLAIERTENFASARLTEDRFSRLSEARFSRASRQR